MCKVNVQIFKNNKLEIENLDRLYQPPIVS